VRLIQEAPQLESSGEDVARGRMRTWNAECGGLDWMGCHFFFIVAILAIQNV
jgi:hypothetical protein